MLTHEAVSEADLALQALPAQRRLRFGDLFGQGLVGLCDSAALVFMIVRDQTALGLLCAAGSHQLLKLGNLRFLVCQTASESQIWDKTYVGSAGDVDEALRQTAVELVYRLEPVLLVDAHREEAVVVNPGAVLVHLADVLGERVRALDLVHAAQVPQVLPSL